MAASRCAVIAVHGVADQRAGDTARALVDLLVASAPDGVVYEAQAEEPLNLRVDPLPPAGAAAPRTGATPLAEDRSPTKALLQSARSDFHRSDWQAPASAKQAWRTRGQAPAGAAVADRGIAVTDYLLGKQQRNGADSDVYATSRIGMRRSAAGQRTEIDVFELYWADLSRLSGALPRIVTELFTMVFRLSKLGRDTVDEARAALRAQRADNRATNPFWLAWASVSGLQIAIDWLFVNVLALLFLQLALLGAVLLVFGGLGALDPLLLSHLHPLAAALVAVAGLLLLAYRHRDASRRGWWLPLGLVAAGLAPLLAWPALTPWVTFVLVLGAATLASEAGLRIADDRFPFVRSMGRWMGYALVLVLLEAARRQFGAAAGDRFTDLGPWIRSAIFGVELTLLLIKWVWILVGAAMAGWLVAGWVAATERGHESRASVATGRLGLGLSIGAFLALTMAIWAALNGVIGSAVAGVAYRPCIFAAPAAVAAAAKPAPISSPAPSADAARCLWADPGWPAADAAPFLDGRYQASTSAFALVAALLLVLLVFLVAMFVPSILAELKLLVARTRHGLRARGGAGAVVQDDGDAGAARRLGQWLTSGYRSLDGVTHLVFGIGVVLGLAVALAYAGVRTLVELEPLVRNLSQGLLKPLVIGATGITASLVVFGGLLSKYLPGLRGPLDIALDVDNHFREFPRASIPRARIFSRYAALLQHVARGHYDRVVIVAHSQGTVISAELLRYLASDGRHAPVAGARPRVGGRTLPPVALLTLGSPLRQLYAARFPTLYRWVIARRGAVSGPTAADIGVTRWFNAFCSGDYVGRWLWSEHDDADPADALGHPMVDRGNALFGRRDAYAGFAPMPPLAATLDAATEVEVCLGLGAHTHYFEREQTTVAWLVDELVRR